MFSIFKKGGSAAKVDFSALGADMHSHLLPGIDDGSPDIGTSLDLKKGLEDLGFSRFITTPHIMWDLYKNTPQTIGSALGELKQQAGQLNIRAAAEYMLDDHFNVLLEGPEPLQTVWQNMVLVEFSFVSVPLDMKEKIFRMNIRGYQPILAHPERYAYLGGNKKGFEELKGLGCLFQVNLLSLTGYYGKGPRELALYLLGRDFVDLVGTDLHHHRHLEALREGRGIMAALRPLIEKGRLLNPRLSL
jgi:protein-tyrosine phosphatase